jgi:hypothetical protein
MRNLEEDITSDQKKILEYSNELQNLDKESEKKKSIRKIIQETKKDKDTKIACLRTLHSEFLDFAEINPVR